MASGSTFKKLLSVAAAGGLAALLLVTGCGETPAENPEGEPTKAPEQTAAPNANGTGLTEEDLMKDTTAVHECITLSSELGLNFDKGSEPNQVTEAYTWVANELVLNSVNTYKKYDDVTLDLILKSGDTTLTVPGFWDGKNVWRVRFTCPFAGTWTYETRCSDESETGLHGITGTLECKEYSGKLDLYKHGFVKTDKEKKYFVYDDGTPFFYLGDTHWSMAGEKIENFAVSTKKRAEQGFTVIQSEPLGASFTLSDGLSSGDVAGLRKFDKYFWDTADKGLVHANASLFFPSAMPDFIKKFGGYSSVKVGNAITTVEPIRGVEFYDLADSVKEELEKLCRYWVARYGAYPVMWTLGQEVDNDFYWDGGDSHHPEWSFVNNPFIYMADYLHKYDAYSHPLSGHQEGMNTTAASDSAFRECAAHDWFAAQWKWLHFNAPVDYKPLRDFWENGQGKPMVDYEGYYCYLWTKNFGARAQGWMAFTCGGCGYGWGGQDTWCYLSSYDEDKDCSYDGVDVITAQEKKDATWESALEYESTYQMTYMRDFLENTVEDWWTLIPRFDDTSYFTPDGKALYCLASTADGAKTLIYFYNFSDPALAEKPNSSEAEAKQTGTLGSLTPGAEYVYVWFDPVNGKKVSSGTLTADANGQAALGEKLPTDMVLYLCRK